MPPVLSCQLRESICRLASSLSSSSTCDSQKRTTSTAAKQAACSHRDTCEAVVMIPLTPVLLVKQHMQYGQQDTLEGLHVVNIYGLIHCQADEAEQHPSAMRLHRSYSSLHVMQTACTGHLYLIALHLLLPALMKRSRSKRLRCRPPQPLHQHQRHLLCNIICYHTIPLATSTAQQSAGQQLSLPCC